jgi:signal transduction histidine kinase
LINGLRNLFSSGAVSLKLASPLPRRTTQPDDAQIKRRGVPSKHFNLLRSFALLSLLSIILISSASAVMLLRFLASHMLERDAVVTMEFIQRVAETEETELSFTRPELLADEEGLGELFVHIANMPDVVRANVYAPDRSIVWSTDRNLIGKRFDINHELHEALGGQLVFERVRRSDDKKAEYTYFPDDVTEFVENYIPIWNQDHSNVVGVAEIYKVPRALFRAMDEGKWLVWIIATAGAIFLYATLFWIVRRGSIVIHAQQQQLVESETMATVGEMASVVAHGIRNPLASIRSSAELAMENPSCADCEATQAITTDVDRLEQWIRELLLFAQPERSHLQMVNIVDVVRDSLNGFSRALEQQCIELILDFQNVMFSVYGDVTVLGHIFNGLIANALEAMPDGGRLIVDVRTAIHGDQVKVAITDTGAGMSQDQMKKAFKPFYTSKRQGLGVGLSLAKRIIERHGGAITLSSQVGRGTTVSLQFPVESG